MSNMYSFGCTALMGTNKAGTLKPDDSGYYRMVLGAFDAFNSAEQFYPAGPALELLKDSGALMRRIANGALRGEYGHPRKLPGMSDKDFLMRLADIVEQNVSHHIRKIELIPTGMRDEQGRPVVGVIGEIKPMGPHADALERSLNNKDENVCFSIRSITVDRFEHGRYNKFLRAIYTWDYVNEPGMSVAKKWRAPGLEALQEAITDEAGMRSIARTLSRCKNKGLESAGTTVLRETMRELGFTDETRSSGSSIILPRSSSW